MSKVLTYHNLTHGEHWFKADPYGKREIEAIKDPEGGKAKQSPTSIPSPFAQMDLVRNAFANLSQMKDLKGTNIDFRLVSDCLDIGELFFNFNRFSERLSIRAWSKEEDLGKLKRKDERGKPINVPHNRLAEALELFLEQDADAYNFKDFEKLYILEMNHRVIGSTSPSTLFFASPNDLSWINIQMPNNNRLFDNNFKHLHERDEEFQVFMFAFSKAMEQFGRKFRVINDYLERNLNIIERKTPALYDQIRRMDRRSWYDDSLYETLGAGSGNDKVCILTFPLQKKKAFDGVAKSDFTIHSSKFRGNKKPLVLKRGHDGTDRYGKPMKYFNHAYDRKTVIPYYYDDKTPIKERELPGLAGVKYPHLVVSDFLEPSLVRLVYPIQKDKYFSGNLASYAKGNDGQPIEKDYLLPIKKNFFEYFDADFLRQTTKGGKEVFKMEHLAGGSVKVTLRIPVEGGDIAFERTYAPSIDEHSLPRPDLDTNRGVVVELQFGVTIFPFVRWDDPAVVPHYRVMLVDRDVYAHTRNNEYDLAFLKNDQMDGQDSYVAKKIRGDKLKGAPATTQIYIVERNFDFVQVKSVLGNGIILPLWRKGIQGSTAFRFAIDFGTTNTHIEYNTDGNIAPQPFEITELEVQMGTFHDPGIAERDVSLSGTRATLLLEIPNQIFPNRIGETYEHSFPQRTALAETDPLNFGIATFALADFNIPFIYEKKQMPNSTKPHTNLKWSNYTLSTEAERRVRAFFEQLLLMIRTKVMLNSGNLEKTTLLWFYPSSMSPRRVATLETLIQQLFQSYFNSKHEPQRLSESIAPFYWYKESHKTVASEKPVVSIDIGGGTTDVVVYQNNRPQLLTSFRFAANTIFGDGYGDVAVRTNGFVQRYEGRMLQLMEDHNLQDLKGAYKGIRAREKSEDIVALFISMENNKKIRELAKNTPKTFTQLLERDDDMRIVFLVFFISIVYHVAKLLSSKNIDMPRYLTFSGNGSKSLNAISRKRGPLEKLARLVIEKIYNKPYDGDGLNVVRETDKPKEVTCKGGLLIKEKQLDFDAIAGIKMTLIGTGDGNVSDKEKPVTYRELENNKVLLDKVEQEAKTFIDFFFELNKSFNFQDDLGIPAQKLAFYKKELKMDIRTYLLEGLNQRKNDQSDLDRALDETLFFYPLIGSLNHLAYKIAEEFPAES